jgi:hypothetical protein
MKSIKLLILVFGLIKLASAQQINPVWINQIGGPEWDIARTTTNEYITFEIKKDQSNKIDYLTGYYLNDIDGDYPYTPGNLQFAYDANGNMTYEPNKSATITYNQFNLPYKIDFGNNNCLYYFTMPMEIKFLAICLMRTEIHASNIFVAIRFTKRITGKPDIWITLQPLKDE